MRGKAAKTLALIEASKAILQEIQPASVRAVCYRLFVQKLIKDMSKNETNKLGRQLVHAREEKTIPWEWIVDEARSVEITECWDDVDGFFNKVLDAYAKDYWAEQPEKVEVWSEKGTVRGTLAALLDELRVPFRVLHGFNSATEVYNAAQASLDNENPTRVIYIGDFDPAGLFMSEVDLPERLKRYGGNVEVTRVTITEDDVLHGGLPDFPASDKIKDNNHRWFVENHGQRCVELDAMPPPELRARVRRAILAHIDGDAWERSLEIEQEELEKIADWKERILGEDSP